MASGTPVERRSIPEAVVLTCLVVVGAALVVGGVAVVASAVAGVPGGTVAAIAAGIAVLSFVTLRAYVPEERIPWATLVVLTVFTPVLPLVYLSWRWVRSRRIPSPTEARLRPPTRPVHGV